MSTIDLTTGLYVQECCNCHMTFAVPDSFDARRRRDHKSFYCPNGHSQSYSGESEAQKIKRLEDRLAAQQARTDQVRADRDAIQRRLTATKGVVTRTRKRIANGVCPCCDRSFTNLQRHMQAKHPDYAETAPAE